MADAGGDVLFRFLGDASDVEAALHKVDQALNKTGGAAKNAASDVDAALTKQGGAAKKAAVSHNLLTDAEKRYAAVVIGQKAALDAKAKALGISVGEYKKFQVQVDDVTPAVQKTTVELTRTTSAMDKIGPSAGEAESSLRAIAGVLGIVSPEAAGVVSVVAELGGGLEGVSRGAGLMGVSLKGAALGAGAVGVALAALATAAVVVLNQTADARAGFEEYEAILSKTDESTRRLAQSQAVLKLATGDVSGFVADLQIQAALMRGEIDEADVKAGELGGRLADVLRPQLLAAGKAFGENEMAIQQYTEIINSANASQKEQTTALLERDKALAARAGLQGTIDDLKALQQTGTTAITDYTDAMGAAGDAVDEVAGKTSKAAESQKALNDEAERALALLQQQEDANTQLNSMIAESQADEMTARQAINAELRAQLQLIDELASKGGDADLVHLATVEAERDYRQELLELRDAELAKQKEIDDQASSAIDARREQATAAAVAITSATAGLIGDLSQTFMAAAEQQSAATKRTAILFFRLAQAAAIAEAVMNASVAITQVWSSWAAFPPVAIALSAVAAGATGIQIAKIASQEPPSFGDTPGAIRAGPAGLTANFAPSDYVIAAQNPRDAQRQANELSGGATTIQVVPIPVYKHWGRHEVDAIRQGRLGAELHRRTAAGRVGW